MADRKKQKQLEQARQSGQIDPEVDTETGAMINPHNPEFITKRPWYLGDSGPSLKHHSVQKQDHALSMKEADALLQNKWETAQRTKSASTFRKGACKNCGAMGHKTHECVERPRSGKRAAWKSGMDIAPDDSRLDLEEHGKVAFDAKRDRWQGYHPDQYKEVVERYARIDEERRRVKQEEQQRHDEEKRRRLKEKQERADRRAAAKAAMANAANGDASSDASGDEADLSGSDTAAAAEAAANGSNGAGDNSGNGVTGNGVNGNDAAGNGTASGKGKGDKAKARARAAAAALAALGSGTDSGSDSDSDYDSDDDDDDEDDTKDFVQKEVDQRDFQGRVARQGGLGGAQMKTTVRNLRIREDRAKYLYNLDPDSAYYDPKSRAMRENPIPGANPEELAFAGDNFARYTGDVKHHARTQIFAWEAAERGQELHPIADPSQAELLHRQFVDKKQKLKDDQRQSILDKYGGEEHAKAPDARLVMGQTEAYVEYDRSGRVVRGAPKAIARSKYEEDIFPGNHTSVWGSFLDMRSLRWGFACCHSLVRNSYCTGEAGRSANDESNSALGIDAAGQRRMLEARPAAERTGQAALTSRSDLYGTGVDNPDLDADKLKEALKKEANFQKKSIEQDDRKRKYNSMKSSEVTMEDMEAYRMLKRNTEDPLATLSSDVLLGEDGKEEQEPEEEEEEERAVGGSGKGKGVGKAAAKAAAGSGSSGKKRR